MTKEDLKRLLFAKDQPKLRAESVRLLRDTGRALLAVKKKKIPPVVYVDEKGRRWDIWDVDFEG